MITKGNMKRKNDTIEKIKTLQRYLTNSRIEKEVGLSNGYLKVILSCKHPLAPSTEKKVNEYYLRVIKDLVEKM